MSSFFAEQQRKETRAADIMSRTASLSRSPRTPTSAPAVQGSQSFSGAARRAPVDVSAEKLAALDPKDIANAVMHASATVRLPVLEQLNSSAINKLNVVRQVVEALAKPDDLQPYQSVEGAFASLSSIDFSSSGTALPGWLRDSMISTFVTYFTTADEKYTPLVVGDVQKLNLHLDVALKLLDWIDDTCQSARVYRALRAIQLLKVASPEMITRILAQMHHYSPVTMEDLSTGRKEPACLDTAIAVIEAFHETSFNAKVLEVINKLLQDPPVYGTRNHAPTQRRRFVTALISLLQLKFAPRIRKYQESQEVRGPDCTRCDVTRCYRHGRWPRAPKMNEEWRPARSHGPTLSSATSRIPWRASLAPQSPPCTTTLATRRWTFARLPLLLSRTWPSAPCSARW